MELLEWAVQKMKIHKAAIASLFESNEQVLDAEEIYSIGESLES